MSSLVEIEWAERMAQYWEKKGRTRISVMDFNEISGRSKQRVQGEIRGNKF